MRIQTPPGKSAARLLVYTTGGHITVDLSMLLIQIEFIISRRRLDPQLVLRPARGCFEHGPKKTCGICNFAK
jgi:hypothetical protein